MKSRILLVSFAIVIAFGAGLVGCGGEGVQEYSLTISSTEGGSVTTPGQGTESFTYDEGTVVNLVAEPDEGYRFVGWTGDVDNIADVGDAVTTITMNANCYISAGFEQVGLFADPNLEAAVREAIGIPEGRIHPGDLEALTSLHAYEMDIEDLTGLEHCVGLTTLYLHDNQIIDISPLGSLTALENLTLQGNQIADISPLVNLTNLVLLYLHYNNISDISPLANLTGVQRLRLEYNQIAEISALADAADLEWLLLHYNQISDVSPLANLRSLTGLGMQGNQLTDIHPLANLTDLTELGLASNLIADISPLTSLTNLERLYLGDNRISDISPLSPLTSLTSLGLSGNQISDIAPLSNFTKLTGLSLSGHQIGDISPLVDLNGLTALYLPDSEISDISLLCDLTNLTELYLYNNQITDISPLAGLTELTEAYLAGNEISDISPLANLNNLTFLSLYDNDVSDVSTLVENEGLDMGDVIYLGRNPLSANCTNTYIPQLEARGVTVYASAEGGVDVVSVTPAPGTLLEGGSSVEFAVVVAYELDGVESGIVGAEIGLASGQARPIATRVVGHGTGTVILVGTIDVDSLHESLQENETYEGIAYLGVTIAHKHGGTRHLFEWKHMPEYAYPISISE